MRGDGRERSVPLQLRGSRNHAAAAGVLAAPSRFASLLMRKSTARLPLGAALISFFSFLSVWTRLCWTAECCVIFIYFQGNNVLVC